MAEAAPEIKQCPRCAEDIRLEALICRYCRQEFAVRHMGYCATCHRRVDVGSGSACPTCGTAVLDVVVESEAIGEPAPAGGAVSVVAPAAAPGPQGGAWSAPPNAAVPEGAVASVSRQATAAVGALRPGIAPSLLHVVAASLHGLAAVGVLILFFVQFAVEPATRAIRESGFMKEKLILGPGALVMPIVCLIVLSFPQLYPWRKRRGRLSLTAEERDVFAAFRAQLRDRLNVRFLWKQRWFRVRAAVAAVLWAGGLAITELSRPAGWDDKLAEIQPGYYIGIGLMVLGLLSVVVLLVLPQRTVQVDDEGNIFTS